MMRKNTFNDQMAFDYVVYMMIGSYFKSAGCASPIFEEKMRLYYLEEKHDVQYKMEDVCIAYAEKVLLKELPSSVWEDGVKVKILPLKGSVKVMAFVGPKFTLAVSGDYKGGKTKLDHRLWLK